jgi:RNA polymerase sigma-B factor
MSEGIAVENGRDARRDRVIEAHLPLVRRLAHRLSGRGESFEDLVQVGSLALVRAVDRVPADRASTLTAYVARCVEGEMRRHLRDRSSVVRVPRRARAEGLGATLVPDDGAALELEDGEQAEELALTRALVTSAARCLDGRERRVVALRYFLDLSQAEVGEAVGLSQVHVSRLLRGASDKMRARLERGAPARPW